MPEPGTLAVTENSGVLKAHRNATCGYHSLMKTQGPKESAKGAEARIADRRLPLDRATSSLLSLSQPAL